MTGTAGQERAMKGKAMSENQARHSHWCEDSVSDNGNFKMTSKTQEPLRSAWDSYEPRAHRPALGSTWIWERDKPHAREAITVVAVEWNGEEWWVTTESVSGRTSNDLSRFWEACWPDPDPNEVRVGDEIRWYGAPSFQKAMPSGWIPQGLGSRRDWSKIGEDLWRRVA